MPIIINEFEIIPESQNERKPPVMAEQPATKQPAPDPEAVLRITRLQRERMRRLRAD